MIFIDTNVAIALRDVDMPTHQLVASLPEAPVISIVTRIELESGVNRDVSGLGHRRHLLDEMLSTLPVQMFTNADILAYGRIVLQLGYDRRTTLDRLIAAQAIARNATLITRNAGDFRRIADLTLIEW